MGDVGSEFVGCMSHVGDDEWCSQIVIVVLKTEVIPLTVSLHFCS